MRTPRRKMAIIAVTISLFWSTPVGGAAALEQTNPPPVAQGFEERLIGLAPGASPEDVVAAMYPDDAGAQLELLELLDPKVSRDSLTPSAVEAPHAAAQSGIGTAWKVAKCVASIGAFIAGNALLITKASKFGGVAKGAKLIVQAGNRQERLKLLIAIFGEVSGLGAVASQCG